MAACLAWALFAEAVAERAGFFQGAGAGPDLGGVGFGCEPFADEEAEIFHAGGGGEVDGAGDGAGSARRRRSERVNGSCLVLVDRFRLAASGRARSASRSADPPARMES
jgi:hypothetical protein